MQERRPVPGRCVSASSGVYYMSMSDKVCLTLTFSTRIPQPDGSFEFRLTAYFENEAVANDFGNYAAGLLFPPQIRYRGASPVAPLPAAPARESFPPSSQQ